MKDARDRRRHARYDVVDLPGVVDGFRRCEALKLSAGGALLKLADELPLDGEVGVTLQLGSVTFRSPAYVVFVGPDLEEAGTFRVAVAFKDTPAEDQARLLAYIERVLAAADIG
jgi:hypothetical protein